VALSVGRPLATNQRIAAAVRRTNPLIGVLGEGLEPCAFGAGSLTGDDVA